MIRWKDETTLNSIFSLKQPLGRIGYWVWLFAIWVPGISLWVGAAIAVDDGLLTPAEGSIAKYTLFLVCFAIGLLPFARRLRHIGLSLVLAPALYILPILLMLVGAWMSENQSTDAQILLAGLLVFGSPVIWLVMLLMAGLFPGKEL